MIGSFNLLDYPDSHNINDERGVNMSQIQDMKKKILRW